MKSAFRTKETIYIETSTNKVFPLIPAGRIVPTTWEQTFTTFEDDQRTLDLHLMRGIDGSGKGNSTLGKWRIAGIPPAPKGEQRIGVKIRVGVDGSVGLSATRTNQALAVIFLTEMFPKIPLTFKVPSIPRENIIQQPCPACKRNFVIRTTNWKDEPFALCLDCGTEFDLPETPVSNDRAPWEDLPPELLEILGVEAPHKPGGLPMEELQELKEKGFDLNQADEPDLLIDANKILQQIPGMIFGQKSTVDELNPEEILRLAGDPLPEDKRRNCPKCDAIISRDAIRCEWCGQNL